MSERKPISKAKLTAYKRHWRTVDKVCDALSHEFIHNRLKLKDVAQGGQLATGTVQRFFQRGRYGKYATYSLFHGPTFTTVVAIAGQVGMEITLRRKRR